MIPSLSHRVQSVSCVSPIDLLERDEGSGIHPQFPGQVISVDYQGKITLTSVRRFDGFYIFKCLVSRYRHTVMVMKKIRFDAGSTENSAETVIFLKANCIQVDPSAVKSQYQNPFEREVQTFSKGLAALPAD